MLHIVSYNILGVGKEETQKKVDAVLREMPADVWILPEVYEDTRLPEGFHFFWEGEQSIKGLGVVVRKGLEVKQIECKEAFLPYCIPLLVEGKQIIAMWPTMIDAASKLAYPKILDYNVRLLIPMLSQQPALIAGDFNCYVGQKGETKSCSIATIYNQLWEAGFKSAYHETMGEELGRETCSTLNFLNRGKRFFHIDYAFANAPVENFHLIGWQESPIKSDHCALVLDFL